jgi:hypothetical protein
MAISWTYRTAENFQQQDESPDQSALRWINANAREGWEFDQVLNLKGLEKDILLFRKSN